MTDVLDAPTVPTASEDDWRHRSACRDRDRALFFPPPVSANTEEEPPYPSPQVLAICAFCPVRERCLEYALDNRIEYGVYGGLSGYQRGLLLKPLTRRRCPGCGSDEVENLGRNQICIACGISWDGSLPSGEDGVA